MIFAFQHQKRVLKKMRQTFGNQQMSEMWLYAHFHRTDERQWAFTKLEGREVLVFFCVGEAKHQQKEKFYKKADGYRKVFLLKR